MKKHIGLILLALITMVFPAGVAMAHTEMLPVAIAVGAADEGSHDEGDEAVVDDHHDEGDEAVVDDHHDEGDEAVVDDHHDEGDEAMVDDHHANDTTSHAADDGHHDEAFSWSSLIPLFAGVGVATVASGAGWSMFKKELSGLQLAIIALTLVTGVLHLFLGLASERLLLLNGIGYLGLLGLLYLPIGLPSGLKNLLRIGLMFYTLATIAGYFYLHSPAQYDALAISSKVIEVVLVIVLAVRVMQAQSVEA